VDNLIKIKKQTYKAEHVEQTINITVAFLVH